MFKTNLLRFVQIIYLFNILWFVQGFHTNGVEIYDLEFEGDEFLKEASDWQILTADPISVNSNIFFGQTFLGRYNFSRTSNNILRSYDHLYSHNIAYFSIIFQIYGNWAQNDVIQIQFSTTAIIINPNAIQKSTINNEQEVYIFELKGKNSHSGSTINFLITYFVDNPANLGFGFRDVNVFLRNSTTESYFCLYSNKSSQYDCKCNSDEYLDSSSTCHSCHSLCSKCFGPSLNDCYEYQPEVEIPCDQPNILFINGSCLPASSCTSGFDQNTDQDITLCEPVCNSTSEYNYWNGTCSSDCPEPLISYNEGDWKFCKPECLSDSGEPITCPSTNPNTTTNTTFSRLVLTYKGDILNGYVVNAKITPVVNDSSTEFLIVGISGLTQGEDYKATIYKNAVSNFDIALELLGPNTLNSIPIACVYSYKDVILNGTLILPKLRYNPDYVIQMGEILGTVAHVSFFVLVSEKICLALTEFSWIWSALPENQYSYYLLFLNLKYLKHTQMYLKGLANIEYMFTNVSLSSNSKEDEANSASKVEINEEIPTDIFEATGLLCILLAGLLGLILLNQLVKTYLGRSSLSCIFSVKIFRTILSKFEWNGFLKVCLTYSLPLNFAAFNYINSCISKKITATNMQMALAVTIIIAMIFMMKGFFGMIISIPKQKKHRITSEEKYGILWDKLNVQSFSRFYHWFLALRGVFISYVVIFMDISPLVQIFSLIIFQCGVLFFFFNRGQLHSVFKGSKFNLIVFLDEAFLLAQKIFILIYYICEGLDLDDTIIITAGVLIVLPKLLSQAIWMVYLVTVVCSRRKLYAWKINLLLEAMKLKKKQPKEKQKRRKIRRVRSTKKMIQVHPDQEQIKVEIPAFKEFSFDTPRTARTHDGSNKYIES